MAKLRCMRCVFALLLIALTCSVFAQTKPASDDARMKWWREARLGMFIHWGLYAIPAGKWGNRTDYGEWIRESAHIPVHEYEKFEKQFNPVNFDADKWVAMAKAAGMKYIVITTKHHDGFNLFDSKYSDWDVMHTPFKRDIMKELSAACHRQGIQMCWYHSIMDWHHPDYLPRRGWEVKNRPVDGANMDRYVQYLRNEVSQLLTDYGPIGVMWFDGEWEPTWNNDYGKPLYDLCRRLQPNVIVNNRVSNNRAGSMESSAPVVNQVGDFTTPEQYIPPTGLPGVDWETCMTMNDHWGYNAYDKNWKSSPELIRNIVDIASKGGNYLLNVGPMANGEFPPQAVERLRDIGEFMKVNSEAIYATEASVFDALPWGRSTTKREVDTTTIYLHVFDWPADGNLPVAAMQNQIESATLLATGEPVQVERNGYDVTLHVPSTSPSAVSSTIKLVMKGEPVVFRSPVIDTSSPILVDRVSVAIQNRIQGSELRYTLDGSDPNQTSALYSAPITVENTATIKTASFLNGQRVSAVAAATLTKVQPWPAASVVANQPGLVCKEYHGDWDVMPDFTKLKPGKTFTADVLGYPTKAGVPEERVGRVFTGYVQIPADSAYTFELTSDDGSRLWVDDKLVVDNDGLHGATAKTGVAPLAKGPHAIRVEWFNKTGDAALALKMLRAGGGAEPLVLVH